uniref:Uncharacterized protein n=1 Tax=Anguilla anguilla TaxID=7936 RepID=A0A0E9XCD7_ANGAN
MCVNNKWSSKRGKNPEITARSNIHSIQLLTLLTSWESSCEQIQKCTIEAGSIIHTSDSVTPVVLYK